MKLLKAIGIGALAGVTAVLIYQTFPPVGILIALVSTYGAIWWVGRETGKRIYKAIAGIIWFLVIYRAGTFGVGDELLILANNLGTSLFFLGTLTAMISTLRRI